MVDERLNKLPVRLAQENGDIISLDVTSYNITVERAHSHIPVPFKSGQTFGIDLNMPTISIALTGYLVDDEGTNFFGAGATGEIDVGLDLPNDFGLTVQPGLNFGGYVKQGGTGSVPFPPLASTVGFLPDDWDIDGVVGDINTIPGNLPAIVKAGDLHGRYFDMPVAKWASDEDSSDFSIRFVFDGYREGTVYETYAYLNKDRDTTLTYASTVGGTSGTSVTIRMGGGQNVRDWFGDVTSGGEYEVYSKTPGTGVITFLGPIEEIAPGGVLTDITIHNTGGGTWPSISVDDIIGIGASASGNATGLSSTGGRPAFGVSSGVPGLPRHVDSQNGQPVVAIPVRDFIIGGPEKLKDQTTFRDLGGATNPIDYMAYKIEKALISPVSLGTKVTGDTSGTSCNDAFSIERKKSRVGKNEGLLVVSQKVAGALPAGQNGENRRIIHHNFIRSASPIFESFRGGKDALKVKSAGDKAQDLMGTIGNMQNFHKGSLMSGTALAPLVNPFIKLLDTTTQAFYDLTRWNTDGESNRDYIGGIQIPYWSTVSQMVIKQTLTYITNTIRLPADNTYTVFTVRTNPHGYLVGDTVRISNFAIGSGGIMNSSLDGDHIITAVDIDKNTFTADVAMGINSGTPSGNVQRINVEATSIIRDQRNFFLTYGNKNAANPATSGAAGQIFHASEPFAKLGWHQEVLNGIRGAIDEFTVDFNAEDRLYEFDMTMIALDHII